MAVTVYRADHPSRFVLCDELSADDILVCEGVATDEQRSQFLAGAKSEPAGEPEAKKRGRPRKEESEAEAE